MEWVEVRVVDRVVASHWLDLSCILSHEGCSLREVFWGYGKKCVIVRHWAGSHEVSSVVRKMYFGSVSCSAGCRALATPVIFRRDACRAACL